jgi:hypothetical protein
MPASLRFWRDAVQAFRELGIKPTSNVDGDALRAEPFYYSARWSPPLPEGERRAAFLIHRQGVETWDDMLNPATGAVWTEREMWWIPPESDNLDRIRAVKGMEAVAASLPDATLSLIQRRDYATPLKAGNVLYVPTSQSFVRIDKVNLRRKTALMRPLTIDEEGNALSQAHSEFEIDWDDLELRKYPRAAMWGTRVAGHPKSTYPNSQGWSINGEDVNLA